MDAALRCCARRAHSTSAEALAAQRALQCAPEAYEEWPPASSDAALQQDQNEEAGTEAVYLQLLEDHERALGHYLLAQRASWSGYDSEEGE